MMHHVRKEDGSTLPEATINHNNDVCKEALHIGIQVEKAEAKGIFEKNRDYVQGFARKSNVPDVIIIEDDNDNSEVDNYDSEAATRRSQSHCHSSSSRHSLIESSFHTSELSDSSDEEDCVVIEPHATVPPSFLDKRLLKTRKRPRPPADMPLESSRKRSSPSDLSDCEIIVDSDGKIRQDWEEAALRRRVGKARYRADSEESTSISNHANSDAWRSPKGKQTGDLRSHARRSWEHATDQQPGHGFSASVGGFSAHATEKREDEPSDQQDSNLNVSDVDSDDSNEEASSAGNIPNSLGHGAYDILKTVEPGLSDVDSDDSNEEASSAGNILNSLGHGADEILKAVEPGLSDVKHFDSWSRFDDVEASGRLNYTHHANICLRPSQGVEEGVTRASLDNIVTDREMLKKTNEFRHADEEEWARRHLELQKQAEEAQRERKRRKLEAERRTEMEARQKRRLDEIRQSQMKEEETSSMKEQVRDRIQADLERVAATCRDMATLLRRLGVAVDGGPFATTQQVTAGYKRALLRFHPDRAAALAKSDPTHQVEAEEKFKLVSRMKNVLPLVSSSLFR